MDPIEGRMDKTVKQAESVRDILEDNDSIDETKFDMWGVRAIRRLAKCERDRPGADAPDYEHEAYQHERAATLASTAADLLESVGYSDVITDVQQGQLLVAKDVSYRAVSDHHYAAHEIRRRGRKEAREKADEGYPEQEEAEQ